MIAAATPSFDLVVAVDLDWGIGKDNALPWPKLRGDLAHFRRVTSTTARDGARNAIVMGRKTWQSKEVAGKPLPKRLNVVVTRGELAVPDGVIVARGLDAAVAAAAAAPDVERVFVVGGAHLYRDALADRALARIYLTRVAARYGCDARIPDLDAAGFARDATWDGEATGDDSGVSYRIERLIRPPAA
nr:dihydrofolate reductase [Kofleriaceae bacterium]